MATSGSVNFTQTSGELVKDSLILLGVSFPGEVIQTETKNFALNMLNKIVKDLSAQGAKMWGLEEAVILFDNDVVAYTFADKSASGGKVAVGIKSSGLVKTALSADEAALQTVLTVDSSTGMSASDNVIIQLDSGDRHETTIVSVDDATTITITAAIPTAAADNNVLYTYTPTTDELSYPELIRNVRLRDNSGNEIFMDIYSRKEYMEVADKLTEGRPMAYYFDKQLSNRVIYIWPEPDSLQESIRFDFVKSLEDVDTLTENLYFPDNWLRALTWILAAELALPYGKMEKMPVLEAKARELIDNALRADDEDVSINFMPDIREP